MITVCIRLAAHERWGNSWGQVVQALPGRSQNMAKNRWNSNARKSAGDRFGKTGTIDAQAKVAALTDKDYSVIAASNAKRSGGRGAAAAAAAHLVIDTDDDDDEGESWSHDDYYCSGEEKVSSSSKRRTKSSLTPSTSNRSLTALVSAAVTAFSRLQEQHGDSGPQVGATLHYRWGQEPIDVESELVKVIDFDDDGRCTLACLEIDDHRHRVRRDSLATESQSKPFTFLAKVTAADYGDRWLDADPALVPPKNDKNILLPLPLLDDNNDDNRSTHAFSIISKDHPPLGDISAVMSDHRPVVYDDDDKEQVPTHTVMTLRPKKKPRYLLEDV